MLTIISPAKNQEKTVENPPKRPKQSFTRKRNCVYVFVSIVHMNLY